MGICPARRILSDKCDPHLRVGAPNEAELAATYCLDRSCIRKLRRKQMIRQPVFIKEDKKPLKPKADEQSHQPAKHIEETARLAGSVEKAKDPGKVGDAKD
jgi:hypothetical protein